MPKSGKDLINEIIEPKGSLNYTEEPSTQLKQTEAENKQLSFEQENKPAPVNKENFITVDGIEFEIKPTKFKYFRNAQAAIYNILIVMPLHEFVLIPAGKFDKKRDGDQMLFDFLCAVLDDAAFVEEHYDNFDAEVLERILEIYKRLNHISDREQERKNREAQMTA